MTNLSPCHSAPAGHRRDESPRPAPCSRNAALRAPPDERSHRPFDNFQCENKQFEYDARKMAADTDTKYNNTCRSWFPRLCRHDRGTKWDSLYRRRRMRFEMAFD